MRMRIGLAFGLVAAMVRCGPAPVKCGDAVCTPEQRCTSEKTCVTDFPPQLTLEAPLDGAMLTTQTVLIKGTAKDDDLGLVVSASSDDTHWAPVVVAADGSFSLELKLPHLDAEMGKATVRARDAKGHELQLSRSLKVDNSPPVCALTAPLDGASITTTGSVTLTMTASDGSQVLSNPKVSVDGTSFVAPTGKDGNYSFNWVTTSENGVVHPLVFRIEDVNGFVCEATAMVTVDNVKPTVAFSTPLAASLLGPSFFASGGLMGGTARDGMRALKSVTLDFADGAGPRVATTAGVAWSVNLPAPANEDYQPHTAVVVVTDLAGNTATASMMVTVDVQPPQLAITSPNQNAKLNAANFPSGNNAPLSWTLSDGDSQLTIGLLQPDGGLTSPPAIPTSPTDNPRSYTATLQAKDRAGNSSTAAVSFSVDRVAPTLTASAPANNTRMFAGTAWADFSEPMTGGNGLNLNPNVGGSWPTSQHYDVGPLAKDTVYSVTSGTLTDLHGNPLAPSNFRFHTETWVPPSGAQLLTGHDVVYEATADIEGVINVLARAGGSVDWIQFSPADGSSKVIDTFSTGSVGMLVSARTVAADLSSRRVAGVTFNTGGGNQVRYSINGGAPVTMAGDALIPTQAFAAEGSGLAELGVISGGFYQRVGRANLALGLSSIEAVRFSDTRWEVIHQTGGGTQSQSFGCSASSCTLSGVKTLGGGSVGTANAAISKSCSVHGYQSAGTELTTLFRWQPTCGSTVDPCAIDTTENDNFDQVIVDPTADGTFYGYNINASGGYQFKKRSLSATTCGGAVSDYGAPVTLGSIFGTPALIAIRGAPGFIYPSGGANLRYISP
jgi:hypothetical protein